ncbi:MAG: Asp-tRNA(Asn)/Glu-tRNA(Gln) amidotransferase subunit GatC [Pseudomonadota bacterium]|nr:Asp-tRNA(Asn)/Glu-tRNA(Gln) amidotransferase subunit GatC [Pseudomonadota bacterium]
MALDKDAVTNIARLARIRIDEAEMGALADELSNILGWIKELEEVDTSEAEPMTSVTEMDWRRRSDEVDDGEYPDRVLANAPEPSGKFYTVPKVVE